MRRFLCGLFLLAISSAPVAAQHFKAETKQPSNPRLVFVHSEQVNKLVRTRIQTCLTQMSREMGVLGREMPLIVVMHVSDKEAETLNVHTTSVRRIDGTAGGTYYELWITSKASMVHVADGMQRILEKEFQISVSDVEREAMVRRVSRFMASTVSADGYGG